MRLKERAIIITGASQGFGAAVADTFASQGARLLLTARNFDELSRVKTTLEQKYKATVHIMKADASRPTDNNKMVELAVSKFGSVDAIVANAGVYGPKGPIESVDWDEWCQALDINLKGVILGCRSVIPVMKKARQGKIIIMSGGGATKPMPYFSAYAASKAGVIRFMETLAEELADHNIDVNAVAPGALNTKLLEEVLAAGPAVVGQAFYNQSMSQKASGGTPFQKGADLCAFLASKESDGVSGKLISAVWDPWESFPKHLDDLKGTDVYTLRRIVPEDRKLNW